jgi:DNA-binding CsgD family transcriptional regulator
MKMRQKRDMMTVQEVADVLNIPEYTLKYHIRRLYPGLMHTGRVTFLNEDQVENIKTELINNYHIHDNIDNKMTIKEVSNVLGINDETIKWHIRKIYPGLMKKGVTTYLTEEQVENIKQHMRHTNSVTSTVTSTEYGDSVNLDILSQYIDNDAHQNIIRSRDYFKKRYNEEILSHTE